MPVGARTQLYTGCRRGDPAALDALLYGCADEVYALALTAMYDEAEAHECLRETWRRLLRSLGRLRFNKVPQDRVRRIAYRVVAERVSSADQLRRLRSAGCDLVQGNLLGPPGPAEKLATTAPY